MNLFLSFVISSSLFVLFVLFSLCIYVSIIMSCIVIAECIFVFLVIFGSISLDFLLRGLICMLGIPSIGLVGLRGHFRDQAACSSDPHDAHFAGS